MDDKIMLISKWKLRAGITSELIGVLQSLASKVELAEQGTLIYRIHLQSRAPLDTYIDPIKPQPNPIPDSLQQEVVFLEVYENAEAFSVHVKGEVFNSFKDSTLEYFQLDPLKQGWPITETEFLTLQSGFVRQDA